MAKHYAVTTDSFELEDHYDSNGNDRWQKAKVDITVDANGKADWKITMTNDSSENGYGSGRALYLQITVDNKVIAGMGVDPWPDTGNYITHGTDFSAPGYKVYPCGNDTSATGSLTVSSSKFSVNIQICCMQSMAQYPERGATKTFTFTRDYWEDGEPPVASPDIIATGLNKFRITGVNGTGGHNNDIETSTIYYNLNGTQESVSGLSTTSGGTVSIDIDASSVQDDIYASIEAWVHNTFTREPSGKSSNKKTALYMAINNPAISITDNKDNRFKLTGTAATAGSENNPVASTKYYWGYTTAYDNEHTNNDVLYNLQSTTAASKNVYAKAVATPTYFGREKIAESSPNPTAIKYYVAPNNPSKPKLKYNKNRLTTKENWKFDWTAAVPGNNFEHNKVKGYRIRLYKNDKSIPIIGSDGTQLSIIRTNTEDDYIYDSESTTTSITIDPAVHGFRAGDIVELGLFAYSKNGLEQLLFSGDVINEVLSDPETVQNAGIMRIKAGTNDWREGQVYVKVDNTWVEAETVSVKTSDGWKESE